MNKDFSKNKSYGTSTPRTSAPSKKAKSGKGKPLTKKAPNKQY